MPETVTSRKGRDPPGNREGSAVSQTRPQPSRATKENGINREDDEAELQAALDAPITSPRRAVKFRLAYAGRSRGDRNVLRDYKYARSGLDSTRVDVLDLDMYDPRTYETAAEWRNDLRRLLEGHQLGFNLRGLWWNGRSENLLTASAECGWNKLVDGIEESAEDVITLSYVLKVEDDRTRVFEDMKGGGRLHEKRSAQALHREGLERRFGKERVRRAKLVRAGMQEQG